MNTTIPKKALVAMSERCPGGHATAYRIVPPEEALVSAFDRSFHFGDSIYEVTRSYEGILFSLEEHLARLKRSAELAAFDRMPDLDAIREMTRETCRAFFARFGKTDVYARITVSTGVGDLNIDRRMASGPYPLVFVKELERVPESAYREGAHFAVVSRRRNLVTALDPAMKSGNYLNNVLALVEARRMGASDALLVNYQGFVTEGTTNNFHAVRDGTVWTPPLSVGILAGITRDWLFLACERERIRIEERLFTEADLALCQEMLYTSSTKEVMPVTRLSGRPVGDGAPGPVTRRLSAALKKIVSEYCKAHAAESLWP